MQKEIPKNNIGAANIYKKHRCIQKHWHLVKTWRMLKTWRIPNLRRMVKTWRLVKTLWMAKTWRLVKTRRMVKTWRIQNIRRPQNCWRRRKSRRTRWRTALLFRLGRICNCWLLSGPADEHVLLLVDVELRKCSLQVRNGSPMPSFYGRTRVPYCTGYL